MALKKNKVSTTQTSREWRNNKFLSFLVNIFLVCLVISGIVAASFLVTNILLFGVEVVLPNIRNLMTGSLSFEQLVATFKESVLTSRLDTHFQVYVIAFFVLFFFIGNKVKPYMRRRRLEKKRGGTH